MKFDSSQIAVPSTLTLDARNGLITRNDGTPDNGHIKVRVDDGTLTIDRAVDADAGGDVLLRAYGPGRDVLVDATVTSDSGDITIFAEDDVLTTAAIGTDGNIYIRALDTDLVGVRGIVIGQTVTSDLSNVLLQSSGDITLNANVEATALNVGVVADFNVVQNANIIAGRDILVRALGGDVTMAATTSSRTGAGRSIIVDATDDITLGLLNATATGRVRSTLAATLSMVILPGCRHQHHRRPVAHVSWQLYWQSRPWPGRSKSQRN